MNDKRDFPDWIHFGEDILVVYSRLPSVERRVAILHETTTTKTTKTTRADVSSRRTGFANDRPALSSA